MTIKRKPKAEEIFYADVDSGSGKRIRLIAALTQDGWTGSVLDLSTGEWFPQGQWADLESAERQAEGYMRLAFRVSGDVIWVPGPPD